MSGGTPVGITEIAERPSGLNWASDDAILYSLSGGIWGIPAAGGIPERVIAVQDGEVPAGPELLPDGRTILFTLGVSDDWDEAQIDPASRRALYTPRRRLTAL